MGTKRFVRPTPTEAKNYADSIGFTAFNVDKWFAHNDTIGWLVGKARTPMKSWKGSIRTWFCNWKEWNPNVATTPSVRIQGQTLKERYLNEG